nr:NTP transferase domain-containing protein [Bacteroidota bacterium]
MSKYAIILAGGKGTRLKPYTVALPKALVPIGDFPILEIIIKQLAHQGFERISLTVNHQADIIKAYFGDGRKWNVKIDYSFEDKPLGTMGPLTIIPDLPDDFLVMNGDVLTNLNYHDFYEYHIQHKNLFTVSGYKRTINSEFGVLEIGKNNQLTDFKEKPLIHYNVSMGIYMGNREILKFIPRDLHFGFDQLMLKLIELDKP